MRGSSKSSFGWLVAFGLAACTGEETLSDAGVVAHVGEPASADAGFADSGPADTGPRVRTLSGDEGWFPAGEVTNHMLTPGFDMQMFNLGWSTGGGVRMTRRVDVRTPGPRDEWVEIPNRGAAPNATFLAGFGKAPPGRLRMELWLVQTVTATAPGEGFDVALHGLAEDGTQRALVLEPDGAAAVELDGRRWTPYAAETEGRWLGFVTFLLLNGSSTPLGIGSPHVGLAPARSGGVRPGQVRVARPAERAALSAVWSEARGRGRPPEDPAAHLPEVFRSGR